MSTASKTMGLKRICTGCGTRFYDLNKRPIICPSCEVEFTGEIKIKSRRGRAAAEVKPAVEKAPVVAAPVEEDEILEEDAGVEVVSLDDVDDKSSNADDDDAAVLDDDDALKDIAEFDDEIDDALGNDDDATLLEEDDD